MSVPEDRPASRRASLAGWFPIAYTERGLARSAAWTTRGEIPPGAAVLRYR